MFLTLDLKIKWYFCIVSQKARAVHVLDTGSQRESGPSARARPEPGGAWEPGLCTTQENPYLKFLNIMGNDLFPV